MEKITTVGLDLAKQVMAVHGAGAEGRMILRKVLRRDQLLSWSGSLWPCVMAMEACGGAHHWARELTRQGHTVPIIAAEYVQPFRLGRVRPRDHPHGNPFPHTPGHGPSRG